MKTTYFLFAFVFISLISCDNEPIPDTFNFGVENSFKPRKNYHAIDNVLVFTITEVRDSRCPSDVVCISEGKADVIIQIIRPVADTIILNTQGNQVDTVGKYSFQIIDVSPYPISTKTIQFEDYSIVLNIAKLK